MLSYYQNLFEDPAFLQGLSLLMDLDMVFEVGVMWDRLDDALELARRRENVRFVLDHAGMPLERGPRKPGHMAGRVAGDLGDCENVVVKISGLGMGRHALSTQQMGPLVNDACWRPSVPSARCWARTGQSTAFSATLASWSHRSRRLRQSSRRLSSGRVARYRGARISDLSSQPLVPRSHGRGALSGETLRRGSSIKEEILLHAVLIMTPREKRYTHE